MLRIHEDACPFCKAPWAVWELRGSGHRGLVQKICSGKAPHLVEYYAERVGG